MRIHTCYFCSSPCYPGHGITFVRNDCKVFRFCRSKCHRNFKMKRNPRKVRWTKSFRKVSGKEMAVSGSLDLEKVRNKPVRYDRNLMGATVKAMKRIAQIKEIREKRFHQIRMKVRSVLVCSRTPNTSRPTADLFRAALHRDSRTVLYISLTNLSHQEKKKMQKASIKAMQTDIALNAVSTGRTRVQELKQSKIGVKASKDKDVEMK